MILLCGQPVRFNRIRGQIEGISQKVLSQTLKSLEQDGLVSRKAVPTVPITVDYSITPLGRTLAATIDGLRICYRMHTSLRASFDAPENASLFNVPGRRRRLAP